MAKLSPNQSLALDALNNLLSTADVSHADKGAWKKSAKTIVSEKPVSVNTASMVKAGAVEGIKVAVGGRIVEVFAPVKKAVEVST